jgi:hypothetical protein
VLGIALGVVGSKIVENEVKSLQLAEEKISKDVLKLFSNPENPRSLLRRSSSTTESYSHLEGIDDHLSFDTPANDDACRQSATWCGSLCLLLMRYVPALAPLFLGAFWIAMFEGWTWDETVYYMVVTCTTIGYGDFTPDRDSIRLFAVLYIPLGVGAMGHFLGTIANFIIEQRRNACDTKLWKHEITLEDLKSMDTDDDGVVNEVEFLTFMLVAMKKVDRELIDRIREHFHHLDLTNSGTLVRADLELMAKKRLRSDRTKLRLSEYKVRSLPSQLLLITTMILIPILWSAGERSQRL